MLVEIGSTIVSLVYCISKNPKPKQTKKTPKYLLFETCEITPPGQEK